VLVLGSVPCLSASFDAGLSLSKLKPLGGMLQGEDYELRVFQVV